MIFTILFLILLTFMISILFFKNIEYEFFIIWTGLLSVILILFSLCTNKITNLENNITNYEEKIIEIKAEQYDIKNRNSEEYKKNEDKIIDLTIKYNDEVSKYNNILKKDKEKFILFRWHFNTKEKEFYPLEVTTEYVAPDYYVA